MAGKFELNRGTSNKYYFNLKAGNGQVILSSESYESREGAANGIESVKKNASDAGNYERRANRNDEPYFVLKAGNGQEIGRSEFYSSTAAMENGIESVMENAPTASVVDLTV